MKNTASRNRFRSIVSLLVFLAGLNSCKRTQDEGKNRSGKSQTAEKVKLFGAWESPLFPNAFLFLNESGSSIQVRLRGYDIYPYYLSGTGHLTAKGTCQGTAMFKMGYTNLEGEWNAGLIEDSLDFQCPVISSFPTKWSLAYPNLKEQEAEQYLRLAETLNLFSNHDSTEVSRIDFDASTERLGDFTVHYHDGRPSTRYQVGKKGQIKKLD